MGFVMLLLSVVTLRVLMKFLHLDCPRPSRRDT